MKREDPPNQKNDTVLIKKNGVVLTNPDMIKKTIDTAVSKIVELDTSVIRKKTSEYISNLDLRDDKDYTSVKYVHVNGKFVKKIYR